MMRPPGSVLITCGESGPARTGWLLQALNGLAAGLELDATAAIRLSHTPVFLIQQLPEEVPWQLVLRLRAHPQPAICSELRTAATGVLDACNKQHRAAFAPWAEDSAQGTSLLHWSHELTPAQARRLEHLTLPLRAPYPPPQLGPALALLDQLLESRSVVGQRDEELGETNRGAIALYSELEESRQRLVSLNEELEERIAEQAAEANHRRRVEAALRESEQRFKRMADTAPAMLWITDTDNRVTFLSRSWHAFTGQSEEEALGFGWLKAVHPDEEVAAARAQREAAAACAPFTSEYRVRRRDGTYCWVINTGHPRFDNDTFSGYIGNVIDISDRKAAVEALRQANAELEERVTERTNELQHRADQLARMASELALTEQRERRRLAQILHDHLQQLLVGAQLGLELLTRRGVDPDSERAIEGVRELISEAIEESRSLTVELSPPILHEAGLAAGLDWLARWMMEKHNLQVDLHIDEGAAAEREDVRVLLFQSVRELLFNVVKHSGVDYATVYFTTADNDVVRIIVEDEGDGFDMDQTVAEMGELHGGFGLFSIQERLTMLGGGMEVSSRPGQGARFLLYAPMEAVPGMVEDAPAALFPDHDMSPPKPQTSGTIRLLLVDDHDVMRQGLTALLTDLDDMEVVAEAADGLEAIEQARRYHPNVILMDFSMPRLDGVEATRRLHQIFPEIAIIGLSMYEEPDRASAMLNAGASAYLSKSGNPDMLLSTIRKVYAGAVVG